MSATPRSYPQLVGLHQVTEGDGPPVVLVHGFTQTGVSWRHVARRLACDHTVIRVDAPGHGGSSAIQADLSATADLLAETGGRATYVGYSMGARAVLRLALDHPDLVAGLVLVGATAGIDDPDERAERRRLDHVRAERIEKLGVAAFLEEWLAQPLFANLPDDVEERRARATNTASGLASSLRLSGTGTMDPPWWSALSEIRAPTVAMAGQLDLKFVKLGRRVADTVPGAKLVTVPGAGHAAHLHAPELVADRVREISARSG